MFETVDGKEMVCWRKRIIAGARNIHKEKVKRKGRTLFLSPENPAHDILLVGYISTFKLTYSYQKKKKNFQVILTSSIKVEHVVVCIILEWGLLNYAEMFIALNEHLQVTKGTLFSYLLF
jgi:hypothetical protein